MSDPDARIRTSLERLGDADRADLNGVWESLAARRDRRRRRRITVVAVSAAALAIAGGTAVNRMWPASSDTVVATTPATTPDDGTADRSDADRSPAGADVPTYTLDLRGAELLRGDTLTASNTDVAVWGDGQGAYASLSVRPGLAGTYSAPSGFGRRMLKDGGFPEDAGDAWLSAPEDPRNAAMWWVRPDGDLWILRAYWYGDRLPDDAEATLRAWALDISTGPTTNPPYVLADEELSLIGFDAAGEKPSRSRVWSYKGHEVTLLVLDRSSSAAGLSNLLARGRPERTEVPGLGQVWAVGQTFGWAVPASDGAWATLLVPDALTGEASTILHALTRE